MVFSTEFYINDCNSGACVPTAKPVVLKESGATAWVDGCNALGATVGNFCMDIAIKKAKEFGVGWVSAKSEFVSIFYFLIAAPINTWIKITHLSIIKVH